VAKDRPHPQQLSNPAAAPVQVNYQQGLVFNQPGGYIQSIALQPGDALAYYDSGSALRDQRRFDAALAAFDQAIALKPDYAEAYNSRGIVLANLNRFDEALIAFDRAIALKPDYAEAYNNGALVLHSLGRLAEALAGFDKALALQPDNARLYNNRGDTLQGLKRVDDALASYDKALALKPDYAQAHYNRGTMLKDLRRLDEALDGLDRAIALKPDYAAAYNNRGIAMQDLKRLDDALGSFDKAIALIPDSAEFHANQAYCLLQMGRLEQGWRLHEWRKRTEMPVGNRSFQQPLWLGKEDIANKTVFAHWEQGLGDTIQFCRYGKLLRARGARVVMSVQEPLHRLLRQLGPDIEVVNHNQVPAAFDYHCPLMSLPLAFETTVASIPSEQRYISADRELSKAWLVRLPPPAKPRIGIVWSGNAKHKNDRNRSIDLPALAPLFSPDAHWISLHQELRDGDAASLAQLRQIAFYGNELKDFADTAALIDLLDLIITVDTGVAHLAGAMGKPVWILLPYNSDWRWLSARDDSPWYPTARLFRQGDGESWQQVIACVRDALHDFIQSRA
jgi:tetratricopeptide (TPR) repeat protein